MTAIRSRVRLNLSDEVHAFVRSLAVLQGKTQHRVIVELIEAAKAERDATLREVS